MPVSKLSDCDDPESARELVWRGFAGALVCPCDEYVI